ncbi:UDP-glucose 4-epimerase GalE [Humibacter ginsenosidimutans]|uniref:UDP-glucose 4-epimerase n=1 Tax=Humibacter ginsenosidimutans TaxID=2599293 RepID=A0A5B8M556_9MICO|nr:UDP-glucose 4-epimerase GalE [Humibacter ginsenosidimutans]QDZ14975.1 UDP-glucose 4-epimerase GalE [Humibacter ginsenosidimutans]
MRVLLTGGAGYIGTHTAVALAEAGHEPLIADSLVGARSEALSRVETLVGRTVPALIGDVRDEDALNAFIRAHAPVDAVIHLAGLKSVSDSLVEPVDYYGVNIAAAVSVLRAMRANDITTIVFSSSATVYGEPDQLPVSEDANTPLSLSSPYGKTKRIIEELLRDVCAADSRMTAIALRYFNPVGAHPSGLIGEDPQSEPGNLMPIVSRVAAGALPCVHVFGADYDTPDGTALRDYIHVVDLASGHVAALGDRDPGFRAYNLGTGRATSVLELVTAFEQVVGRPIAREAAPRRSGDVAISVADSGRAESALGWRATRTINDACADQWNWQTGAAADLPR